MTQEEREDWNALLDRLDDLESRIRELEAEARERPDSGNELGRPA